MRARYVCCLAHALNRAWRHDWRIAVHGAGWAVLCHQRTVMKRHITYTCHAAYNARLSYTICNISCAHRTVRTLRSMCCHPTTLSTTSARVKRCAPSEYPKYARVPSEYPKYARVPSEYPKYARVPSEYPKYARVLLLPYDQLFHERCSLGALTLWRFCTLAPTASRLVAPCAVILEGAWHCNPACAYHQGQHEASDVRTWQQSGFPHNPHPWPDRCIVHTCHGLHPWLGMLVHVRCGGGGLNWCGAAGL